MVKFAQVHCNACGHNTNHAIRSAFSATSEDFIPSAGESGINFEVVETFEIMQCLGCEELVVREFFEHEGQGESDPCFYPPRISRRTPSWKQKLPTGIRAVIDEVYRALQADSPRLATMGTRTIVDLVLLDRVGDVGTFRDKLKAMEDKGYIGRRNREFVGAALEAGSAAAHRGMAPEQEDLARVMDIVESLLESVYVLEEAAKRLRAVTPPRPKRGKYSGPSR